MPDLSAEEIVRVMLGAYHNHTTGFDFIRGLEQRTGMTFMADISVPENLCYANSQSVRPEYKTTFTTADLWNYVTNQPIHQNIDITTYLKSILPNNKQQFWQISLYNQRS